MGEDLKTFEQFKTMFPNNGEQYDPTHDNVQRWKWHLRQANQQQQYDIFPREVLEDWQAVIEKTAVETWNDMPAYMRVVYLELSGYFPGVQLFACGSRVNGGYVEKWSSHEFRQLRASAGRTNKDSSDYDFICPEPCQPVKNLPGHFDRVRYLPQGEKSIPIPMWDFKKLPEHEHPRVVEALEVGNHRLLIEIHNTYKLSPWVYCCEVGGVINWFTHGVNTGQIKNNSPEGNPASTG